MTPREYAELQKMAGPMSGRNVIGETTESLHRFLLDGWTYPGNPPRIEEDMEFVPKDREEVIYVYMYRVAQNANLQNQRRLRRAPVFVRDNPDEGGEVYLHRPPLLVDVFYLIAVHSKFRSDAERLLGWVLLRLNEATHLVYRPRRFLLPDGREVDSLGRTYDSQNFRGYANLLPNELVMPAPEDGPEREEERDDEGLHIEKISLSLVDDLTVGDAINLFTLHEAPYRPFLTYRARMALDGPLYRSSGGATIRIGRLASTEPPQPHPHSTSSSNGRLRPNQAPLTPKNLPGPKAFKIRKQPTEPDSEE